MKWYSLESNNIIISNNNIQTRNNCKDDVDNDWLSLSNALGTVPKILAKTV